MPMNAVTFYRIGRWCYERRIPLVPKLMHRLIFLFFNSYIPMSAEIGEGTTFGYGGMGVVLHGRCRIGSRVAIGQQVTIGGRSRIWGVPVVGDRCFIGAGAKILGAVRIGAESVVGANAVVIEDLPPRSVEAGMPARVIRRDIDIAEYYDGDFTPGTEAGDKYPGDKVADETIIETIKEPEGFERLKQEWNELLQNSTSDCLFLTWEWLWSWWKHLAEGRKLFIITVRWGCSEAKINLCPLIKLSGHSWQSYLASLGPEHRYNFQRRLKNLAKQATVEFESVRTEEQRPEALAYLIALHHQRWRDRGGSDGLHKPSLLAFHEELSRLALERGWLRLFVLLVDGQPAASL